MIVLSPPNALQAKTQRLQRSWTSLIRLIVDRFGIIRSRTFGLKSHSHLARPIRALAQVIEHFSRFWNQQHTLVFSVCKVVGVDRCRIAITKVDLRANLFGNSGRECYLNPAVLRSPLIGADSSDVG